MRRRQLLVGSGAVVTAALAGCIGSAQPNGTDSSRTLTVRKSGEVTAEPDQADVHVSIEATGDDPAAVRDELSERSQQLTDGLVASGLDETQITTGRFSIREHVDRDSGPVDDSNAETTDPTRYAGSHSFRIAVDDVASTGSVVDTAVESGADTVEWIEFRLSAERRAELRQQALDSALAAARTEAEFVAGDVDKSVVDVQHVDTGDGGVSAVRQEFAMDEAAGSGRSTELQPEELTVHATAKITYSIE
jgi:uncharacterized protein YggE